MSDSNKSEFMQPQVVHDSWYEVSTTHGTVWIPKDVIGHGDASPDDLKEYCEGDYQEHSVLCGWGARLSAPGYLDCTEWTVFDGEEEAKEFLRSEYEVEV